MKTINKDIGLRIKDLREKKGLTLEALAAMVGVSRQMIWDYENHKHEPSRKRMHKLAQALGVSVDYFAGKTHNNLQKPDNESGFWEFMSIGQKIRELRRIKKMTSEELGAKIGVSKQQINHYELDRNIPPLDKLDKIAKVFNVDSTYFIDKSSIDRQEDNRNTMDSGIPDFIRKKLSWDYIQKLESDIERIRDEKDKLYKDYRAISDQLIANLESKAQQDRETWERLKSLLDAYEERLRDAS